MSPFSLSSQPFDELSRRAREALARHRERHAPTGFGFALSDGISYLDPIAWDTVTGSHGPFLRRSFWAAMEEVGPKNVRPRYVLIYRNKTPVAAVAAQVVEAAAANAVKEAGDVRWQDPVGMAAKKWGVSAIKSVNVRMLVCGNLLSTGPHGVAFAPGEDPDVLWPAVAEALYRVRRADRLFGEMDMVLVKDFKSGESSGIEKLKRFSYRPVTTDPDMVLRIPSGWRTYADYLTAMTSKYRKTLVQINDAVAAGGGLVEFSSDITANEHLLYPLYKRIYDRAAVRLASFQPGFLGALSRALGEDFRCVTLRCGSEFLGFLSIIKNRDQAVGYYMGMNEDANREIPVYFRLLQAAVEEAIRMGCGHLSFGRTALEPKARLGARPQPLEVWVRHRLPWLNVLLRGLLGAIPHDVAPDRNPFK